MFLSQSLSKRLSKVFGYAVYGVIVLFFIFMLLFSIILTMFAYSSPSIENSTTLDYPAVEYDFTLR